MAEYEKPLPPITVDSKPYWDAAKEHRLTGQRCDDCEKFRFPPATSCWYCLSPNNTWVDLSGRGTVWSYILMHQPYYKGFIPELPYPVCVVETEEGLRFISNLVNVDNDEIKIGMAIEVMFDDVTEEVTLPKFQPAQG